ncbi:ABC transporter [Mangrovactinospora gilvigrisea]|uniref:ABC transporter n=1 Tax=Mangrovactinospora gilvigrisea TaxID=1428644 RepID=A0A1J7BG81_9ACTN|nr:ABC transporter [Mangrovactinospora gilvigrisea]
MIEFQHLTKRYARHRPAVDDLTCTVAEGRVTGLVGPNGAGKSTVLRTLLGLHRPTAGRALIRGRGYAELRAPQREVGAVLDAGARTAHPGRRVRDHLRWLARAGGLPASRVPAVLAAVDLDGERRAGALSLGMTARLALAAALLGDPAVLVLDEPSNGLDPAGAHWLRGTLRTLAAEGRTVLVSSHAMGELARTADHLLVIAGGRLRADAPVADLAPDGDPETLEAAFLRLTEAR